VAFQLRALVFLAVAPVTLVPQAVSAEVAHRLVKDFTFRALPMQAAEVSRVDCRGVAEVRSAEEVAEAAVVVLLGLAATQA
jgi:hypothetical protein